MQAVVIRMARAGNGVPVFTAASRSMELKRPFGATFDADRAVWMYPAFFPVAQRVVEDLKILSRDMPIEFSDAALAYIKELPLVEDKYKNRQLPEGFSFVTPPFDHQVLGLCHAYYMPRSALFYDPGLGKSKVAIDLVRLLRFTGYTDLVVVLGPLVTIRNWGKEIDRHAGGQLKWGAVLGTVAQKTEVIAQAARREFDILLVTYDTARNFVEQIFNTVPYYVAVLDESHMCKEWSASRTKAAFEIVQKTTRRLIMTGTPTLGNPTDLYGQFKILGDFFMPETPFQYKQKFLNVAAHNKHLVLGYKNLNLLNERTAFLSLRRTKEECLDLPPQTFVNIDVDLSTGQKKATNELVKEMGVDLGTLEKYLRQAAEGDQDALGFLQLPHVAVLLLKLLQITAGFILHDLADPQLCDNWQCPLVKKCVAAKIKPYTKQCLVVQSRPDPRVEVFEKNPKLQALEELLDSLLEDPTHKVIVWGYFHAEMDLLEACLKDRGVSYVRVDGKTGSKIQPIVDKFNADPSIRVYLGQISTGVGITLNAANYTIYYSLTFSLGSYLQSLDRNYRIGQTRNVTVYRLLGKQTIEPTIMRLLENKVDVDAALTVPGSIVKDMLRVVTRPNLMTGAYDKEDGT